MSGYYAVAKAIGVSMGSTRRVGVIREGSDEVIYYIKLNEAVAMVADDIAEVAGDRSIRVMKNSGVVVAKSSDELPNSKQERAFESSAIDKHPRFFNGGLCRTEHQPKKLSRYSGARIGRQ